MRAKLRLGETVETIMSRPPIVIGASASVQEAARLMAVNRVGSVMVVDDEGRLVGIVTERDIVRLVAFSGADLSRDYPIARVMSSDPVTLGPRENLLDALAKMCENNVRHLPVVDEKGKPIGMVSNRDIIDALIESLLAVRRSR